MMFFSRSGRDYCYLLGDTGDATCSSDPFRSLLLLVGSDRGVVLPQVC